MITEDDFLAARYALGVAGLAEITIAEARLNGDAGFAALVGRYERVFGGLGDETAEITPSASVWSRIDQSIRDSEMVPGTETVRTESMSWEPFLPGVERKVLFADKDGATGLVLYKVEAGAQVGNHSHGITEECLVLEGEIEVDGITLRPGDLHLAFPHQRHGPLYSRKGAVVYIRGDLQIQP